MKTTINTTKTEKTIKVQTPQGERLKIFRMERGFSKKSSFARHIKSTHATISAIENNGREISDTVIDLIHFAFPDVNPIWLKTGALPKLLTTKTITESKKILGEEIRETQESYLLRCRECEKKDNKINELRDRIDQFIAEINELRKENMRLEKEASELKKLRSG